jgi:hypothetical protein
MMPDGLDTPRLGKALDDPKPRPICKCLSSGALHITQTSRAVKPLGNPRRLRAPGSHPPQTHPSVSRVPASGAGSPNVYACLPMGTDAPATLAVLPPFFLRNESEGGRRKNGGVSRRCAPEGATGRESLDRRALGRTFCMILSGWFAGHARLRIVRAGRDAAWALPFERVAHSLGVKVNADENTHCR